MTNNLLYQPLPKPSRATLNKYGLSYTEWLDIYWKQQGKCAVCEKEFKVGQRINVDHVHVRGWKQMTPDKRKGYIRGLLCYTCNKFAAMRGVTPDKARNLWLYLRNYQVRITPEALAAQPPLREMRPDEEVVKSLNVRHTNKQQDKKHQSG